jgi:hypothetical protein
MFLSHLQQPTATAFLKSKNGLLPVFSHIGRLSVGSLKFSDIHLPTSKKFRRDPESNACPQHLYGKGGLSHGAGNEIRTRDTKLGKLVLYQLSYARLLTGDIMA